MPNTRELRRRIRSVKNTAQITRAMQMVAATKMRKAQTQALAGRPYNMTLNEAVTMLLPKIEQKTHPLLQEKTTGKSAVLLLSTDKSLCGSLNTNLFRTMLNFVNTGPHSREGGNPSNKFSFYTLGKKGRQLVVKSGWDLIADFENTDLVHFRTASQVAKLAVQSFLKGEIKELYIAYPDFISALRQEPKVIKILPIDYKSLIETLSPELQNSTSASLRGVRNERRGNLNQAEQTSEFLFEPNLSELLEFVLNHFVQIKIYQAMLETKASEHSARMIAMQNATDNAKELVDDLTLSYNQTRQAAITSELLEITSAQAALE